MNSQKKQYDIQELLIRFLENDLNDSQRTRLLEWSRSHSKAVKEYCSFVKDYAIIDSGVSGQIEPEYGNSDDTRFDHALWAALIEDQYTASEIDIPEEEPQQELIQKVIYLPRKKRKLTKSQFFTLVMSAAAILFLVLFVRFAPERPYAVEVATLIDQIDVEWADLATNLSKGDRLLTNRSPLTLAKGVVKIQYDEGVEVLVEGPATFEMERSGMYLEYGRLYSRVSGAGLGFKVQTPTSQFVDLGTEFGIQADIDGSTQLHVIKGKVQLFAGSKEDDKISQTVTTDTALAYNANTRKTQAILYDKNRFVSQIDSKTKLILRGGSNFYKAAVAASKPIAYYRFDQRKDRLGFEEISTSDTLCDFSESVTFATGLAIDADHANQSLYLNGDAESEVFLLDKVIEITKGNTLSISLWIRPAPEVDDLQNIICYTNSQKQPEIYKKYQIYLSDDKRVGFNFFSRGPTSYTTLGQEMTDEAIVREPFSLLTQGPLLTDQWSHVVACYSETKAELYVNGRLRESIDIPQRVAGYHEGGYWGIGCAAGSDLGGNNYGRASRKMNYKGFIDEISFYDRKLSAQEVRSLYDAALLLN